MTASVRAFIVTDEQMDSAGNNSSYADIEVNQDYEATLASIEDYGEADAPKGWIATFRIEGLPFKYWVPFSDAARWKLVAFVEAFEPDFFEQRDENNQTPPINVNQYVNQVVGAHVILDDELDIPRKVIDYVFNHTGEEVTVDDVPVL